MAKLHTVAKARPSTKARKCRRCGHEVQLGESYKYLDKRMGFARYSTQRVIYCHQHFPKQSELASGKKATLLAIGEVLAECINAAEDASDLEAAMEVAAQDANSLADEYDEGADNIEEGFGHSTEQSDAMREQGDELRNWADELEVFVPIDDDLETSREEAMEKAGEMPL